ncbi:carbohydrate ABC transporter permease [Brevibacillus fluminis]|uniref:Carbohydrate ABC transporter permease n=1 Tax=Brevibacillus fluminis TaxID=511487 RepID=A0A3M8D428_9BACL|nr:carbohydrate ABC transporter permease [Brevibacillus fluminis]RNB82351.1 carbohydrate ABC transporter permease [Brevibacillus fluminis]
MKKAITYTLLILFSLLFLAPFYWMVATALKGPEEVTAYPPQWVPSQLHWSNFIEAWGKAEFTTYLVNSTIVTVMATLGTLVSCSLVAYGFARFTFKGRDLLFMILLATMMIPWEVTMIPLYVEFNWLGWINTLKPLIVPAWFGAPFFIFLLRQFIMTIPRELDEAARIDGANSFQIYLRIILPLTAPALILVAVFQMLSCWNDYLGPLIFLNDMSKYTLPLGLGQLMGTRDVVDTTSLMAITCLISLPPMVIFFFAQRYIVENMAGAGLK